MSGAKHPLSEDGDGAENIPPAAKQQKTHPSTAVETDVTFSIEDLLSIEVKLYSKAKAKLYDPKPPGYEDQPSASKLPQSREGRDIAAAPDDNTAPGPTIEGSGGASVQASIASPPMPQSSETPTSLRGPTQADNQSANIVHGETGGNDISCQDEDEDEENPDPCAAWDWLEAINGFAYLKMSRRKERIGSCKCQLVRRSRMRAAFHYEIEEPSHEMALMGFELFDRYGRLKSDFKDHPIKKGSGIWGDELDFGDILLLDEALIDTSYRGMLLGRRLFEAILNKTRKKTKSFVAITRAVLLATKVHDKPSGATDLKRRAVPDHESRFAVSFCRLLGFRRIGSSDWFALAGHGNHACHALPAVQDYDPPVPACYPPVPDIEFLFGTLDTLLNDAACLEALGQVLCNYSTDGPQWAFPDDKGNTLLHLAAVNFKPECVKWILSQCPRLANVRNHAGDTPVEALTSHLECSRTQSKYGWQRFRPLSDTFSGFTDAAVACLAELKGRDHPHPSELSRLKYGCSCGECISGFLSPRMRHALLAQAEAHYDNLSLGLLEGASGGAVGFVDRYENSMTFLPRGVRDNLRTNKSMREGFVKIYDHIATCLRNKVVPTEKAVLEAMTHASEGPPVTKSYLEGGGNVHAVACDVLKAAMDHDEWAGDGQASRVLGNTVNELPHCRNDHEFGFVSGMCGYKRVAQIRYVSQSTGEPIGIEEMLASGTSSRRMWDVSVHLNDLLRFL